MSITICYNQRARGQCPENHARTDMTTAASYWTLKAQVFQELGWKCCKCGFSDWRALQVDHVAGKGLKHRKALGLAGQQSQFYRYILQHPKQFQLLCANCNWIKRWKRREHERSRFLSALHSVDTFVRLHRRGSRIKSRSYQERARRQ